MSQVTAKLREGTVATIHARQKDSQFHAAP